MPKKPITIKGVQEKAKSIHNLTDNVGSIAKNVWNRARALIEQHTMSTTKMYKKYIIAVKNTPTGGDPDWLRWFDVLDNHFGANNLEFSTERLRNAFNSFKEYYENLHNIQMGKTSQSHVDFNVVGQRALIVHFELGNIEVMLERANMTGSDLYSAGATGSGTPNSVSKSAIPADILMNLENYKLAFSRLARICRDLMSMPDSLFMRKIGKDKLERGLQTAKDVSKYYKDIETQKSWLVFKDKQVDVLAGVGEQKLELVQEQLHERGEAEYAVGTLIKKLWEEEGFGLSEMNKALGMTEDDWANISGSKTLKSQVEQGLADALIGKRTSYKSSTKRKSKPKKSSALKGEQELISLRNELSNTKIVGLAKAKKVVESGAQKEYADVIKLKRLINKRLGAEIRRNMVRPALLNRTGRFSNSAQVTKLQETAKGIRGEYTYLLNPYQTFENTGSKRWPIGYNPKALITKSIRQLAIQYTETRFTQLRRL